MLMPSHHLARAEKAGVMLTLIRVPSDTTPCELVVKLSGKVRIRARVRSVDDGQAVFYRLARVLDELSFELSSEDMYDHVRFDLSDSPFQPLISYEDET